MPDQTTVESRRGQTGALDVNTDIDQLVRVDTDRYHEDPDFRPNPLYQTATLDTSETGGPFHQSIDEVSPVFSEAKARNLVTAARALDPEDDGVGAELVTLPQGAVTVTGSVRSEDDARDELTAKLKNLADNPVTVGGPSPLQQEAAEETDDDARPEMTNPATRAAAARHSGGGSANRQSAARADKKS